MRKNCYQVYQKIWNHKQKVEFESVYLELLTEKMDLDLNLDHQLICTVQPKGKNSRKEPQNSDVADGKWMISRMLQLRYNQLIFLGYENENIPEFQWWKFLILFWGMIAFFTSLYSDYKLIAYYVSSELLSTI